MVAALRIRHGRSVAGWLAAGLTTCSILHSRRRSDSSGHVAAGYGDKPNNVDQGLNSDAVSRTCRSRLEAIRATTSDDLLLRRLVALNSILARYPLASHEVYHQGGVDVLLEIRDRRSDASDEISSWARQACGLLGHAEPISGHGLRVLSLDGGGVRGVISIFVLERLLELSGNRPLGELFDVVAGTSIGTLISALMLFGKKEPGPMAPRFLNLFNSVVRLPLQGSVANLVKYRSKFGNEMVKLLGSHFQDRTLASTARDPGTPKVIFTASLLGSGRAAHPAPFLFRNYRPSPGSNVSRYAGGCNYSLTDACAASAAAPGYFPGINLNGLPLKDGGLLGNNPLSIALHESRLLWGPDTPIQCIVSLGTGLVPLPRPDTEEEFSGSGFVSLDTMSPVGVVDVVQNVINSACNNQLMEHLMEDFLVKEPYYRFNPVLPYDYPPFADDIEEILKLGENFVQENEPRLREVAQRLEVQ
eukprot:scpid69215/ scgid35360/ Calcium-independent phospholipase A2-gamma; Intracellular membrane-associated calcium-independent phospholipase A2 gamma; Patatin-like phospholipase domain-containing protein 8